MPLPQDIALAARTLRKSPGFTLTAVLSIAIGIGASAAVFSMADALLIRERPGIGQPERLVDMGRSQDGEGFDNLSYPNYLDFRDGNTVFSGLAAVKITPEAVGLRAAGISERVFATPVSANYFDVLRVPIAQGRPFRAEEEQPGHPVAVLSHLLWTDRLGADPGVLGTEIRLNGRPFTVIGIAAEGFNGTSVFGTDVWVPIGSFPELTGAESILTMRAGVWLQCVGRLRDGVTLAQAQVELDAQARELERAYPQENRGKGVALARSARVPRMFMPAVGGILTLLFVLVGLVLVIACSNVAGMQLARGLDRGREIAVRLALGAAPRQIVRQLLVESVSLALVAAALGMAAAVAVVRALRTIPFSAVAAMPVQVEFRTDWRLVTFAVALAILTGMLFGLVPALQLAKTSLAGLRGEGTGHTPSRARLRRVFLAAQIAMSVLLVVVAALFIRSLRNATGIDPGFRISDIDVVSLDTRLSGYAPAVRLPVARRLLERAGEVPDVAAAAYVRVLPLTGSGMGLGPLAIPGREDDRLLARLDWNIVSGGYFATMGIPIVSGRTFTENDLESAPGVAIVNETFAARVWPNESAIGKTLRQGAFPGSPLPARSLEIVGVARDTRYRSIGDSPRPFIYVPYTQQYFPDLSLVVRRRAGTSLPSVTAALATVEPNLPIVRAASFETIAAAGLLPSRVVAWFAGVLGLVGIALAGIGIYGVTAFTVSQRRREIGVRMALGAKAPQVLALVIRQEMTTALAGALLGLLGAALGARLLTGLLYGLGPLDPVSFGAGTVLFAAIALIASGLPARRAAAMNPVEALRAE